MKRLSAFALGIVLLAPTFALGMTRRDDRTDQQYLDYGNQFPAVGQMWLGNNWFGSGTLIAPDWVLTAAHVVDRGSTGVNFRINGVRYDAAEYFVNPRWTGSLTPGTDFTLVRLATPVTGVTPIPLYRGNQELRKEVAVVGFGGTGTGSTGWNGTYDFRRRAGSNVVDGAGSFSFGGLNFQNTLILDFDNPNGTTNTLAPLGSAATATDLEMNVIYGDSGGALLVNQGGQWQLAGVTSWLWAYTGGTEGRYGHLSGFARVHGELQWMDQVVPEPASLLALAAGLGALALRRRRK